MSEKNLQKINRIIGDVETTARRVVKKVLLGVGCHCLLRKLEQIVITEHLSLLTVSITNTERSKFLMVASFNIPPYSPCSVFR